jgi:hypothetical protein
MRALEKFSCYKCLGDILRIHPTHHVMRWVIQGGMTSYAVGYTRRYDKLCGGTARLEMTKW